MRAASSRTGGLRSIVRNRKLGVAAGVVLMAIGTWGMISVGSTTLQTIQDGGYNADRGETFQLNSYVFLFTLVAGLVLLLYATISGSKNTPAQQTTA